MTVFDKARYHPRADHIVAFVTWLAARGLLQGVAPAPYDEPDARLLESMDGVLAAEALTPEGVELTEAIYDAFLSAWSDLGKRRKGTNARSRYVERVRPWLDDAHRRYVAGELIGGLVPVQRLLRAGLGEIAERAGLTSLGGRGASAWTRPAPGGWRTGFWFLVARCNLPPPHGGAICVRVSGGAFIVDERESPAIPENRLGCWIGQEGRDRLFAHNRAVAEKLPPIRMWPVADDTLVVPERPYTPHGEPWLRFSDASDVRAAIDLLATLLPPALNAIDAHYA